MSKLEKAKEQKKAFDAKKYIKYLKEKIEQNIMPFGQFKGESLVEIYKEAPEYLYWVLTTDDLLYLKEDSKIIQEAIADRITEEVDEKEFYLKIFDYDIELG